MAESSRNAVRNSGWWQEYISGTTMEAIAARDGVDKATVSRAIRQVRDSIPERKREEIRAELSDFYAMLRERSMEIAELLPAPITAGKDGEPVVDPETGQWVRDYSGRLNAYKTAADMADRERRMFGVDEASRLVLESGEDEAARKLAAESKAYLDQEETE